MVAFTGCIPLPPQAVQVSRLRGYAPEPRQKAHGTRSAGTASVRLPPQTQQVDRADMMPKRSIPFPWQKAQTIEWVSATVAPFIRLLHTPPDLGGWYPMRQAAARWPSGRGGCLPCGARPLPAQADGKLHGLAVSRSGPLDSHYAPGERHDPGEPRALPGAGWHWPGRLGARLEVPGGSEIDGGGRQNRPREF